MSRIELEFDAMPLVSQIVESMSNKEKIASLHIYFYNFFSLQELKNRLDYYKTNINRRQNCTIKDLYLHIGDNDET